MVNIKINNLDCCLQEAHDLQWLQAIGKVFFVFDRNDSGNLSFGVDNGTQKLFIKYAGAKTINYSGSIEEAVTRLQNAGTRYKELKHQHLVELVDELNLQEGYALVFKWEDAKALHALYDEKKTAKEQFSLLSLNDKLKAIDDIFCFHQHVINKGYVAIDFYDGCIMYDFISKQIKICDIDHYEQRPYVNNQGRMWGSSRFMSPEEYQLRAIIDEVTNVYTMGATTFEILGSNRNRSKDLWNASQALYDVAKIAVSNNRNERYQTLQEFYQAWHQALKKGL